MARGVSTGARPLAETKGILETLGQDEAAKFDGLAEQAEYLVIYEREKANAQTSG